MEDEIREVRGNMGEVQSDMDAVKVQIANLGQSILKELAEKAKEVFDELARRNAELANGQAKLEMTMEQMTRSYAEIGQWVSKVESFATVSHQTNARIEVWAQKTEAQNQDVQARLQLLESQPGGAGDGAGRARQSGYLPEKRTVPNEWEGDIAKWRRWRDKTMDFVDTKV